MTAEEEVNDKSKSRSDPEEKAMIWKRHITEG